MVRDSESESIAQETTIVQLERRHVNIVCECDRDRGQLCVDRELLSPGATHYLE